MLQGIDVSHHNGVINWNKVREAGKEFAFIRIGWSGYKGEIHLDQRFHENIVGATKAGLKVGIYVYAYNDSAASAITTANEILQILTANEYQISFPIAFDIEETQDRSLVSQGKEGLANTCNAFCDAIKAGGLTPLIYSYTYFFQAYVATSSLNSDVWIADYRGQRPLAPKNTIWQYAGEAGTCPGIAGACDLNTSDIDYSATSEELIDWRSKYFDLVNSIKELIKDDR